MGRHLFLVWCHWLMINLQTTVSGFEITLATLVEISDLIDQLDERLQALSPELPRVRSAGSDGAAGFGEMLETYRQIFASFEEAVRAASVLGLNDSSAPVIDFSSNVTPTVSAPAPEPPAQPQKIEVTQLPEMQADATREDVQVQTETVRIHPEAEIAEVTQEQVVQAKPEALIQREDVAEIRRTSLSAPAGQQIRLDDVAKPLKPIEMPSAESQVGPIACTPQGVIYAHGLELKRYWPGAATQRARLDSEVPNEAWRLQMVGNSIFCASEEAVSVFALGDLQPVSSFPGHFLAQAPTTDAWVGVRNEEGNLSTMFRDKHGKKFLGSEKIGTFSSSRIFLEPAAESAIAALDCGEVFKVDAASTQHLFNAGKYVEIVGLAVDSSGIVVANRGSDGVWLSLHNHDGKSTHRSPILAKTISHQPVLTSDNLFVFDDLKSELVQISLTTLEEIQRTPVEGITSVGRLMAIEDEEGVTLAILAQTADERPLAVHLVSSRSGASTKLCHLSATRADIGYSAGHIVVSSSSSMQNLIQVFNIYERAMARAA